MAISSKSKKSKTPHKFPDLSSEFVHKIINSIADPVFVKDKHHRWVLLNDAYCKFMGYPREQLIGKSDHDYFPKSEADVFWRKDEVVLKTRRVNINVEEFTDAKGETHILETKKAVYRDRNGECYIVGIIRDITRIKHSEQEARVMQVFLNTILENIPDMVFVKEAKELRFVRFNKAGERLLGFDKKDMIGKNDYDFFPKSEADFFTDKDREVLAGKKILNIKEEPIHTKKGVRYLHTKKVPIFDKKGSPEYLLGISEDITSLKEAQDQLNEWVEAMEHTLEAFSKINATGDYVHINKAFSDLFGYSMGRMKKMNLSNIVTRRDLGNLRTKMDVLGVGEKFECLAKGIKKDNDRIDLRIVLVRANTQTEERLFYLFVKDITEQKYKEALEIKSDLISMISHELRTPLHSLREGISILLEELVGQVNDEQKDILKTAERSATRLIRLVSTALDLQRMEAGGMPFEFGKNSLKDVAKSAVSAIQPIASTRGVVVQMEILKTIPLFYFDADKVEQVIFNLLHNAVKFSPHGKVKIELDKRKDVAEIRVKDNGVGIRKADLGKIFKRFSQVEISKRATHSGAGLGLAISKQIVDYHDGKIFVESKRSQGSTFSFQLPLRKKSA